MKPKKGKIRECLNCESNVDHIVDMIVEVVGARDHYTLSHAKRVAHLACMLATRMKLVTNGQLPKLKYACLLHDIGKIRTPDRILLKVKKFHPSEILMMRRHPEDGADIIRSVPLFQDYLPIVRHHHEWHDGSGYPSGLRGSDIPPLVRVVAVADAFDAMTSKRTYKKIKTVDQALKEIRDFRGSQFNPKVADAFLEMADENREILD